MLVRSIERPDGESVSAVQSKDIGYHFDRNRVQLSVGMLFAILIPTMLRYGSTGLEPVSVATEQNSFLGSVAALVIGYLIQRRLAAFPGISSVGHVIPSFAASFAMVVLWFFCLRLDYSRIPLATNFITTAVAFTVITALAHRARIYRFAVIPGGEACILASLPNVEWIKLDVPSAPSAVWDGVVADLRGDLNDGWKRMIADSAMCGVPVYDVKQAVEQLSGRSEIEHLSENTLGSLNPNRTYFKIKRTIDWIGAIVALVMLAPLFVIVAIAIKLDSSGPIFFRQRRMGFRGEVFRVFKFRTMIHQPQQSASHEGGVNVEARHQAITQTNDKRITRVGGFLRRTRIDELPQILNILSGEMSWIGPRPEAWQLALWYEAELSFYHYRHIVLPGITGWAQVRQGHVADVNEVRDKLYYDFFYVKNFSFWLDVLIVLLTVRIVVTGKGAK